MRDSVERYVPRIPNIGVAAKKALPNIWGDDRLTSVPLHAYSSYAT